MRCSADPRTSSPGSCDWVLTLLAGVLLVLPAQPAAASSCSTVTVPSYFYPGTLWDRSVQPPATLKRTLILNPASGPGTQSDPNYVAAVASARDAGATVIGYVHTSYGARSTDAVLADLKKYTDFYRVTGIFFDEVSSSEGLLYYYQVFSDTVRAAGGLVLLNPGTYPHEGYMALGDQVVAFEGTYDTYRGVQIPAWTANYDRAKFTHLVYSTHRRNMGNALSFSQKRRAGNVYVTDDGGTNPWDSLPGYWSDELNSLGSHCS